MKLVESACGNDGMSVAEGREEVSHGEGVHGQ